MATTKLPVYPPDHPVSLALCAVFGSLDTGRELIETLADTAERVGVPLGSERFDEAAAMAGIPYCRSLDLYLDRQTQREAETLPFHLAQLGRTEAVSDVFEGRSVMGHPFAFQGLMNSDAPTDS